MRAIESNLRGFKSRSGTLMENSCSRAATRSGSAKESSSPLSNNDSWSSAGMGWDVTVFRTLRRRSWRVASGMNSSSCHSLGSVRAIPFIRGSDSVFERDAGVPAERVKSRNVQQFARYAIEPRSVESDLASVVDHARDHRGELGDGEIFAHSYIEQIVAFVIFHDEAGGGGQIVHVQE